jgi:hypothetical protein
MKIRTAIRDRIYSIPGTQQSYRWAYRKAKAAQRRWKELKAARKLMRLGDEGKLLDGLPADQRSHWQGRVKSVVNDPNNAFIPRHSKAGRIVGRSLVMHNGLRVDPLGHYGKPMLEIMIRNRGVHEPEEERAFQYVLEALPARPVMIELGCYWAFYSMWFLKKARRGRAFLIEPIAGKMETGKKNFRANRLAGDFTRGYVGKLDVEGAGPICLDEFAENRGLSDIHILHSDIEGAEYDMLLTAPELLLKQKISFLFISTHANNIHRKCSRLLEEYNYFVIRDTDLTATTSEDGLILACSQLARTDSELIKTLQF